MSYYAPGSAAGSPEFKELLGPKRGDERTGQLCHRSRVLVQFQPAVDTPQVAHPLHAEPPLFGIQESEAQHRREAGVALLQGPQLLGEARSRQVREVQFADQCVVIGADLLVDLNAVALDGDPVAARLEVLLHCRLDGCHLLWPDQCGLVFDQGDNAVDALADCEAGWDLRNRFALTLTGETKVIARLAGPGLSPVQGVRYPFAVGVADRHLDAPSSPLNTVFVLLYSSVHLPGRLRSKRFLQFEKVSHSPVAASTYSSPQIERIWAGTSRITIVVSPLVSVTVVVPGSVSPYSQIRHFM